MKPISDTIYSYQMRYFCVPFNITDRIRTVKLILSQLSKKKCNKETEFVYRSTFKMGWIMQIQRITVKQALLLINRTDPSQSFQEMYLVCTEVFRRSVALQCVCKYLGGFMSHSLSFGSFCVTEIGSFDSVMHLYGNHWPGGRLVLVSLIH